LFYGVVTFLQLIRLGDGRIPLGEIEDEPDFPVRGVMLDISRDKVPTMATLFELVDKFAAWKLNHLELYIEHTFAYQNHRAVWENSSPMTGAEIRMLDDYCRARFIDLVPNQNSFGHLTKWLTKPAYAELAESPEGGDTPWGTHNPLPNSLNPADPRSLALIAELYDELLPHFSSRKFNVGCDETWDLGQGKCKALCAERGKGRVYLDYVRKLYELVKGHGKTMHFWGDIIIKYPELVPELPKDVVVLEWGYDADHPFAEHGAKFEAAGIPFHVCPGTSAWNSIAGRVENGFANLRAAAENGLRYGATGYLITDWGDNGHWQVLPVSYPGFMAGAAMAWNVGGAREC
jgi:N-acetyl-beta-hexosaminidase